MHCGKSQAHPICCDKPMEYDAASWVCKQCKKEKQIICCEDIMIPETEEDVDLPDEVVEEFEEMFDEEENKHEESKKRSYIG